MSTRRLSRRIIRRGVWELGAIVLICLGVFMLMQPFMLLLYSYSFITILAGVIVFTIASKLPD
jgi:hypothetical protein